MDIVRIFGEGKIEEQRVWTVVFSENDYDEYYDLFYFLTDLGAVEEYLNERKEHLESRHWRGIEIIDATKQVVNEIKELNRILHSLNQGIPYNDYKDLDSLFRSLVANNS